MKWKPSKTLQLNRREAVEALQRPGIIALFKRQFAVGMDVALASRESVTQATCYSSAAGPWQVGSPAGSWAGRHSTYPLVRTALFSEPVAAASRTAVGAFTEIRATGGIWVEWTGKTV